MGLCSREGERKIDKREEKHTKAGKCVEGRKVGDEEAAAILDAQ